MLGDWVRCVSGPMQVTPELLVALAQDDDLNENKYVSPIGVTDDILRRNGFNLYYDGRNVQGLDWRAINDELFPEADISLFNDVARLRVSSRICGNISSLYINVRYVHELQQAFRLLGIIKDWKI